MSSLKASTKSIDPYEIARGIIQDPFNKLGLNKDNVAVQKLIDNADALSLVKPENFTIQQWKKALSNNVIRLLRGKQQKMKEAKKEDEFAKTARGVWHEKIRNAKDPETAEKYFRMMQEDLKSDADNKRQMERERTENELRLEHERTENELRIKREDNIYQFISGESEFHLEVLDSKQKSRTLLLSPNAAQGMDGTAKYLDFDGIKYDINDDINNNDDETKENMTQAQIKSPIPRRIIKARRCSDQEGRKFSELPSSNRLARPPSSSSYGKRGSNHLDHYSGVDSASSPSASDVRVRSKKKIEKAASASASGFSNSSSSAVKPLPAASASVPANYGASAVNPSPVASASVFAYQCGASAVNPQPTVSASVSSNCGGLNAETSLPNPNFGQKCNVFVQYDGHGNNKGSTPSPFNTNSKAATKAPASTINQPSFFASQGQVSENLPVAPSTTPFQFSAPNTQSGGTPLNRLFANQRQASGNLFTASGTNQFQSGGTPSNLSGGMHLTQPPNPFANVHLPSPMQIASPAASTADDNMDVGDSSNDKMYA